MQYLNHNPQINTVCILHSNHHAVKRMDCKLLFFFKAQIVITTFALTHWVIDLFHSLFVGRDIFLNIGLINVPFL